MRRSIVFLCALFAQPAIASAEAAPYTEQEFLEMFTEDMCRVDLAKKANALAYLGISPARFCGCAVQETVFAVKGTSYSKLLRSEVARALQERDAGREMAIAPGVLRYMATAMGNSYRSCTAQMTSR